MAREREPSRGETSPLFATLGQLARQQSSRVPLSTALMSYSSIPNSPARPASRPSSRSSNRAHSPSVSLDDNVAVRNQISTLKHSIRHQQAQLQTLENSILRGPRPLPLGLMSPPGHSSSLDSDSLGSQSPVASSSTSKLQRRNSHDVLQELAGPESSLPLPRREGGRASPDEPGIREGIPMDSPSLKRQSSPTRTLSRIPVSSVGNARALADEGLSPSPLRRPAPIDPSSASSTPVHLSISNGPLQPPSPNRRTSMTPGGTTKVLADLQTGVVNARNALENTKAQLRLSQRTVAQLTRQTEDLKESRERLRLENEGLNNVVARKERLLQEVLERARKAEAEAVQLKSQLKTETTTSKKTLREMEVALTESTALSSRSEREYITLRDSIKGLVEGWKRDTTALREEMNRREQISKKEAEELGKKYRKLLDEVKGGNDVRDDVRLLVKEQDVIRSEVEEGFRSEIKGLREQVERSNKDTEKAVEIAKDLARDLARLRKLMQTTDLTSSTEEPISS